MFFGSENCFSIGSVAPVGTLFDARSQCVRAPMEIVQSDRDVSGTWKYGWNPIATGIGSMLWLMIFVATSSTPFCKRCVISMVCANGNCFIHIGWFVNSRRLVTHAALASALASTTSHTTGDC